MNQADWIITLTIIIAGVPVIKMAKAKRVSFYNIFIIVACIILLWISICKNHKDEARSSEKERLSHISDSTNKSEIKRLGNQITTYQDSLAILISKIDSIGLGINKTTGELIILNDQILKKFMFNPKSVINVTSHNQKGGQTAGSISNNK